MNKEVVCPACGSEYYETLTVEDIEKNDFDTELTLIEEVVCGDCQEQYRVRVRYKLYELESEVC